MTFNEKCIEMLGISGKELIKRIMDEDLETLDLGVVEYLLKMAEKENINGNNVSNSKSS